MNNLIKNTIILQAIELGFNFEDHSDSDMKDLTQAMLEFFNENSEKLPRLEDECEVTSNGRSQNVNYGDFTSSGEIVSFSDHWHEAPETKVFHSLFIMEDEGIIKAMKLFYYVGETDGNTPEGFYYNKKSKSHQAYTFDVLFNDDDNSNEKGFQLSFAEAKNYITANNGTTESYFADYKGGTISIICNETKETVFETEIV